MMDLVSIGEVQQALKNGPSVREWHQGGAWLAGGTWIFSELQPDLRWPYRSAIFAKTCDAFGPLGQEHE